MSFIGMRVRRRARRRLEPPRNDENPDIQEMDAEDRDDILVDEVTETNSDALENQQRYQENRGPRRIPVNPEGQNIFDRPNNNNRNAGQNNIPIKSKLTLPKFDCTNAQISIQILECLLDSQRIREDNEKYLYLLSTLKPEHLKKAAQYLASATEIAGDKYTTLRDGLLKLYGNTPVKKFSKMLKEKLEEQRPSEMMTSIKLSMDLPISGEFINPETEQTIKKIWMVKLGPRYRSQLAIFENNMSLSELIETADAIYEHTTDEDATEDINKGGFEEEITKRLSKMEIELQKYKSQSTSPYEGNKSRKPYVKPNQSKASNISQTQKDDPFSSPDACYYHKRFRENANKCDFKTNCPFKNMIKDKPSFLGKPAQ